MPDPFGDCGSGETGLSRQRLGVGPRYSEIYCCCSADWCLVFLYLCLFTVLRHVQVGEDLEEAGVDGGLAGRQPRRVKVRLALVPVDHVGAAGGVGGQRGRARP